MVHQQNKLLTTWGGNNFYSLGLKERKFEQIEIQGEKTRAEYGELYKASFELNLMHFMTELRDRIRDASAA